MPHRLHALLPGRPTPWIMGVLNVTPDSFSDGGLFLDPAPAVAHARAMAADGAAVVDIGGESTAPGSAPVGWRHELARVEPVVRALAPDLTLSIDTYHHRTAARCLELGARLINDTSAGRAEPDIAAVAREHGAVLVMMFAKDSPFPHATDRPASYRDPAAEIADFLLRRIDWALSRGLSEDQLVVDPGMGRFVGPEPAHSWRLLADLARVVERLRPVPVLVATSRKGFLGVPPPDRDPLSQLTALHALQQGALIARTHEPRMMRQFVDAARLMGTLPAPGRKSG